MTPRLALIIGAACALLALGGWISRGLWKPPLDRAVAQTFDARDQAAASDQVIQENAVTARASETRADDRAAVVAATHQLETETRSDPDAETILPPGRLGRLRAHDRELCRIRPGLGGCATAAPGPAALGQ